MEDLSLTNGKNIEKFGSNELACTEVGIREIAKFHAQFIH